MGDYYNNGINYPRASVCLTDAYYKAKSDAQKLYLAIKSSIKENVAFEDGKVIIGKREKHSRTQNYETQPKTAKTNKDYVQGVNNNYGSGFYNFINGILGGKI